MSSGVLIGGNTGVNINIIHRIFAQSTDRRSASLTSNQRKHQTGYLGRKKMNWENMLALSVLWCVVVMVDIRDEISDVSIL